MLTALLYCMLLFAGVALGAAGILHQIGSRNYAFLFRGPVVTAITGLILLLFVAYIHSVQPDMSSGPQPETWLAALFAYVFAIPLGAYYASVVMEIGVKFFKATEIDDNVPKCGAGDQALKAGDFELAEKHYREALRTYPGSWELTLKLAETLRAAGRVRDAASLLDGARRAMLPQSLQSVPEPLPQPKPATPAPGTLAARAQPNAALEVPDASPRQRTARPTYRPFNAADYLLPKDAPPLELSGSPAAAPLAPAPHEGREAAALASPSLRQSEGRPQDAYTTAQQTALLKLTLGLARLYVEEFGDVSRARRLCEQIRPYLLSHVIAQPLATYLSALANRSDAPTPERFARSTPPPNHPPKAPLCAVV